MYIAPTEFTSGIQAPVVPSSMVHLLHRSTSAPGFPASEPVFPKSRYPDNGNPMLVVFNHLLQGASSLRCLEYLESGATTTEAAGRSKSCPMKSSVLTTCECDDDSVSFEDQMKELRDRGRRLKAFYSEWVGVESPELVIRYDSLVHYQRDPLQQNLQQLVTDLVSDNIIEAVVVNRPQLEVNGSSHCFYQLVFPLLLCKCDRSGRFEEEGGEVDGEAMEEAEEGEQLSRESGQAMQSVQDPEQPSVSWYGRNLAGMMDVGVSAGGGAASGVVSKAEKDKEVLEMFQTLKISAYRKGNH